VQFLSLIEAKRDGKTLTAAQINEFVQACAAGRLPDYQLSAFLMAIYFRGLNASETAALTLAMRDSGDVLRFPPDARPLVDKHSTGGVGDKVSLPLAPLLACLGFRVPMISGRGLGITGGTLDKLDSIPGFQTQLSAERIIEVVQEIGCVICGQTERIVPADKILYGLRDVTGTVPSVPLIVASVLSKKLAEDLDALVLDIKFGAAAFMPSLEQARELARSMVCLANDCGIDTRALLSHMDAPLGRAAGNWLEIKEVASVLKPDLFTTPATQPGNGISAGFEDLRQHVLTCAAHLLVQTGKVSTLEAAHQRAGECLASGEPHRKWQQMLAAQGAELDNYQRKLLREVSAPVVAELTATKAGIVSRCDARIIGEVVRDLGGGRLQKDTVLNYDVGVDRLAKPGDRVSIGSLLARVHAQEHRAAAMAQSKLRSAFDISNEPPTITSRIQEIIQPQ